MVYAKHIQNEFLGKVQLCLSLLTSIKGRSSLEDSENQSDHGREENGSVIPSLRKGTLLRHFQYTQSMSLGVILLISSLSKFSVN